jgi:hypothetical protein
VNNGKAYERFAARALISCFSLPQSAVKRNLILPGASGAGHEIDILFRFPESKNFAAVECKNHRKPLGMQLVSAFHGVLQDIRAALPPDESLLGIMAASGGFQSGAVEMAKQFRILLLEIRKPDKQAWNRYVHRFWPGLRPSVGNLDAFLLLNRGVHIVWDPVPHRFGKGRPVAMVMPAGDPPDFVFSGFFVSKSVPVSGALW